MFAAGVPLVESAEVGRRRHGQHRLPGRRAERCATRSPPAMRLQRAMENTGLFPNMVVQMIAVGEESGSLDEMAGKVADFYEADVDDAVDALSSLLEPLIMAILGVLVGGLVIAMYLPIFKLGAVV
ncbi:MAG: type II secretion system F family protein [Chromatiales bacterium]|nr:type II secretion system F family protein [Chromatiales bacterium]